MEDPAGYESMTATHRAVGYSITHSGSGPYRGAYVIEDEDQLTFADGTFDSPDEALAAADEAARREIERRLGAV